MNRNKHKGAIAKKMIVTMKKRTTLNPFADVKIHLTL